MAKSKKDTDRRGVRIAAILVALMACLCIVLSIAGCKKSRQPAESTAGADVAADDDSADDDAAQGSNLADSIIEPINRARDAARAVEKKQEEDLKKSVEGAGGKE